MHILRNMIFFLMAGIIILVALISLQLSKFYDVVETTLSQKLSEYLNDDVFVYQVSLLNSDQLQIENIMASIDNYVISCTQITVTFDPIAVLKGDHRAKSVHVENCFVVDKFHQTSSQNDEIEQEFSGQLPILPFDRLVDHIGTLLIDEITIHHQIRSHDAHATLQKITLERRLGEVVLDAEINAEFGPFSTEHTNISLSEDQMTIFPGDFSFSEPNFFNFDAARIRVAQIEIDLLAQSEIIVRDIDFFPSDPRISRLHFEEFSFTPQTSSFVLRNGILTTPLTIPSFITVINEEVSHSNFEEINEEIDEEPSIGIRAMRLFFNLNETIFSILEDFQKINIPEIEISVEELLFVTESEQIHIRQMNIDSEGHLFGAFAFDETDIRFRTNLSLLDRLELSMDHLNLSGISHFLPENSIVEGEFSLDAVFLFDSETKHLNFTGELSLHDGKLLHSAISTVPLEHINADCSFSSTIDENEQTLFIWLEGNLNGIPLDFSLEIAPNEDSWVVESDFGVREQTSCNTLYEAIPSGMLPNLGPSGMEFLGGSAPRLYFDYRLQDPDSFDFGVSGFPGTCEVSYVRPEFDPIQLNDPLYTHHVTEGVTIENIFVGPGSSSWVSRSSVPSYIPALMYLSEEIDFYSNPGISLRLIRKGIRYSLERNRYAYGGSTISQQLVKNLFLTRIKTLSRKLEEILIVWAMEAVVSKDRIIELYMNCVEFAPDVYGVEAAAEFYFGLEADELTPLEAAYISAIKPRPSSGARHWRRGHSPTRGWLPDRIETLLHRTIRYGEHIPLEEVDFYAPFIVGFPTSERFSGENYPRLERPSRVPVFNRPRPALFNMEK